MEPLPSIDSELIKVSYNLEFLLGHRGCCGRVSVKPYINFEIEICVYPKSKTGEENLKITSGTDLKEIKIEDRNISEPIFQPNNFN